MAGYRSHINFKPNKPLLLQLLEIVNSEKKFFKQKLLASSSALLRQTFCPPQKKIPNSLPVYKIQFFAHILFLKNWVVLVSKFQ